MPSSEPLDASANTQQYSYTSVSPIDTTNLTTTLHIHIYISLTMATQRLSNVLSHITPGKTPLEQMYASPKPLSTTFPRSSPSH